MESSKMFLRMFGVMACIVLYATYCLAKPRFVECADSSECPVGTCCTLGMGRFSVPRCAPEGELHSACRPNDTLPQNTTLYYPSGIVVNVTRVYFVLCPCEIGLYCSEKTGKCQDHYENTKFNELDSVF